MSDPVEAWKEVNDIRDGESLPDRLRRLYPSHTGLESAALIERLQRELTEVRAKTVDECAKVVATAHKFYRGETFRATTDEAKVAYDLVQACLSNVEDSIRALNSNGGGKP